MIPAGEVAAIYAPFSRLLRRNVKQGATYLIGVAGAVSVGKSTISLPYPPGTEGEEKTVIALLHISRIEPILAAAPPPANGA